MNSEQDDSIPLFPCVQFAASAQLEHSLCFLLVEMQAERNCDQLVTGRLLLSIENLVDIGFGQLRKTDIPKGSGPAYYPDSSEIPQYLPRPEGSAPHLLLSVLTKCSYQDSPFIVF